MPIVKKKHVKPEVYLNIDVSLLSGQAIRFDRLYLFERRSFAQLYEFGSPWPQFLPWPARRANLLATGYLFARSDLPLRSLNLEIGSITASRGTMAKRISGIAVVRIQASSDGSLIVKFRAKESIPILGNGSSDGGQSPT